MCRSWVLDEFTSELVGSRLGERKQVVATSLLKELTTSKKMIDGRTVARKHRIHVMRINVISSEG